MQTKVSTVVFCKLPFKANNNNFEMQILSWFDN